MMNREQIANALLWPVDTTLALTVGGLQRVRLLDRLSGAIYYSLKRALLTQFKAINKLYVEGVENIPDEGGVLLASNHQSWLDVQVLGASCPRRVHFIAKDEFRTWPALRHLVKLTQSVFINRSGDQDALEEIARSLREGWAVGIYPEGTIPGEEDIPRTAVDPQTGLLRGRSGVARLSLAANVPIVPVGISGTGRAFPPEIYPRLEVLRLPKATPITVRFGQPIDPADYADRMRNRELYREITDRVMRSISELVDHEANYVPQTVPIGELPTYERIGVLLLHGFTTHLNAVKGLIPYLEASGIDYEMPILRGHGTKPEDLMGVTVRHWFSDAEWALTELRRRVDRVVVVGLSMGGLLALELGMKYPDDIAGVATVAATLKFRDPAVRFVEFLSKFVNYWPTPESFNDPSLKVNCRNYPYFATDAFASLYRYSGEIQNRLDELSVPICILQSKKDQIVAPESANLIYESVGSKYREIIWYQESGHEMMQDLQAEQVFEDIVAFVTRFQKPMESKQSVSAELGG